MKYEFRFVWKMRFVAVVAMVMLVAVAGAEDVVSAKGIAGDGTVPCSDAIQRLIDANPNREIFFPDGTYLLDKPICTPAHPKRSVALRLSNYAKLTAAPGWTNREAMVRLGAIHPANDIKTPGKPGTGYLRDVRCKRNLVNDPDKAHEKYLRD